MNRGRRGCIVWGDGGHEGQRTMYGGGDGGGDVDSALPREWS